MPGSLAWLYHLHFLRTEASAAGTSSWEEGRAMPGQHGMLPYMQLQYTTSRLPQALLALLPEQGHLAPQTFSPHLPPCPALPSFTSLMQKEGEEGGRNQEKEGQTGSMAVRLHLPGASPIWTKSRLRSILTFIHSWHCASWDYCHKTPPSLPIRK